MQQAAFGRGYSDTAPITPTEACTAQLNLTNLLDKRHERRVRSKKKKPCPVFVPKHAARRIPGIAM